MPKPKPTPPRKTLADLITARKKALLTANTLEHEMQRRAAKVCEALGYRGNEAHCCQPLYLLAQDQGTVAFQRGIAAPYSDVILPISTFDKLSEEQ